MVAYLDELSSKARRDSNVMVKSSTRSSSMRSSSSSSSSTTRGGAHIGGIGAYGTVVAFKPTGWCGSRPYEQHQSHGRYGSLILHHVPYSEHSTFDELTQFMNVVNHNRHNHHDTHVRHSNAQIISTVHTAPSTARTTISSLTDSLKAPVRPR